MTPCPACGCNASDGGDAHALAAALRADDIDRALELGLLDPAIACVACSDACRAVTAAGRTQREKALAARERFRARNARLQRRQRAREAQRTPVAVAMETTTTTTTTTALPPAAAAALARARARAATRGQQ